MNDVISRQAAIDAVTKCDANCGIDSAEVLRALPSAQPERKTGHWIMISEADETGNAWYECSCCGKGERHVPIVDVNFCWNCGADMRGERDG